MTVTDILSELPKLPARERDQVLAKLGELQDADLIAGIGPSEEEKAMLDAEWAAFEQDGDVGESAETVLACLRAEDRRR